MQQNQASKQSVAPRQAKVDQVQFANFDWRVGIVICALLASGLFNLFVLVALLQRGAQDLFVHDYTECNGRPYSVSPSVNSHNVTPGGLVSCQKQLLNQMSTFEPIKIACKCNLTFTMAADVDTSNFPVHIYYGMDLLHQNYRFLVYSRDPDQLLGINSTRYRDNCRGFVRDSKNHQLIAPCGALANIMFDDSFRLLYNGNKQINIDRNAITLETDRDNLYNNPRDDHRKNIHYLKKFAKPHRWTHHLLELGESTEAKYGGFRYGPFIVWMRVSTFPTFTKLYGRIQSNETLKSGKYVVEVDYRYLPYTNEPGRKSIRIVTTSYLGVKNDAFLVLILASAAVMTLISLVGIYIRYKFEDRLKERIFRSLMRRQ